MTETNTESTAATEQSVQASAERKPDAAPAKPQEPVAQSASVQDMPQGKPKTQGKPTGKQAADLLFGSVKLQPDRNQSPEGQQERRVLKTINAHSTAMERSLAAARKKNVRKGNPRQMMHFRPARGTEARLPPAERRKQREAYLEWVNTSPYDPSIPYVKRESRRATEDWSYPVMADSYAFLSDPAQRIFENSFQAVDRTLLIVSSVCGKLGSPTLAQSFMDRINTAVTGMERSIEDDGVAKCMSLMDANNIPADKRLAAFDHKREYGVAMHTPEMARFCQCVGLFDMLMSRIDALWFQRIITAEQCQQLKSLWYHRFTTFVHSLHALRNEAFSEAKRRGHKQTAAAEIQAVERATEKTKMEVRDVATGNHPEQKAPSIAMSDEAQEPSVQDEAEEKENGAA